MNNKLNRFKPTCNTTHYACDEVLKRDGGKAKGCCCTGHDCKKFIEPIILDTNPKPTKKRGRK